MAGCATPDGEHGGRPPRPSRAATTRIASSETTTPASRGGFPNLRSIRFASRAARTGAGRNTSGVSGASRIPIRASTRSTELASSASARASSTSGSRAEGLPARHERAARAGESNRPREPRRRLAPERRSRLRFRHAADVDPANGGPVGNRVTFEEGDHAERSGHGGGERRHADHRSRGTYASAGPPRGRQERPRAHRTLKVPDAIEGASRTGPDPRPGRRSRSRSSRPRSPTRGGTRSSLRSPAT